MAAIETADIAALKTSQIAALNTAQVVALTTNQVVALTTAQVSTLSTANVAALTTNQVAAIETADIAALKTAQVVALSTNSIAALTTNQVVALTTGDIAALSTAQVVALTTNQIVALSTAQVSSLTTTGISSLTTNQVAAIETADIAALKTSQIVALSTASVAALTTDQIVSLSTAQISSLTTANIVALTTSQIAAIETTDLVALKTAQVVALTTNSIVALTTNQVAALTTTQAEALTSSQVAAFTTTQISHLVLSTPIVLDLNGDGVRTMSISEGVKFDLFADGDKVNTGWVSSGDGLLVLDRNHDGSIGDGSELFGSSTSLADGTKAIDGYVALRELDTNHDGVISSDDAAFADLQVWVDANSDGVSSTGELKSLASLGIAKISTVASVELSKDNGNLVGLVSTYETTDGASHAAADVWFVADKYHTNETVDSISVDDAIAAINSSIAVDAGASSSVPDEINLVSATVPVPVTQSVVLELPPSDLRTVVSGLARAIGTFDESVGSGGMYSAPGQEAGANGVPKVATQSLAVANMADVMKQFDSNGNMVGAPSTLLASTKSLNLPGAQDTATKGFLAG